MPILNSITEPDRKVFFDPEAHTYCDVDTGKILTSGTTWCKQFKEPFDSARIARKCSTRYGWDESPEDIAAMWSENGTVAANFGTSIHELMEYWERWKALGARVQSRKGKDGNVAYAKHPLLFRILRDFERENKLKRGVVVPEAFISYRNFCGQADRVVVLDEVRKIARIGDYKINGGAYDLGKQTYFKPFNHLPDNKITGYQMQMSFYAHLMTKCGWAIEGLDVYIYDTRWHHEELPVLDLQTGQPKTIEETPPWD